ncbi:hypothetical protein [Halarcobacter ebronensis]|uniref:DUF2249 domain-containing protein n=1 Tax=Halarcobacter ebronensis TaxID=1462615 RepID=A0A4Q1AML6_9BACT|nr:hypothetical protein [Halarcobacter ebronensis]QKF82135.1 hypothetical protein AEBR_1652 [Halarcobacter ebronensis]RXK03485.1 hypothetical protein CRV07_12455 [Halarcobacter ebronensis]
MEKIEVMHSTVDFYKEIKDSLTIYQFDTSMCGPPEPMVNAMIGLQLLDKNSQLIMINHQSPSGLFPKIEQDFNFIEERTKEGKVKITFTLKNSSPKSTNFLENSCNG